MIPGLPHHITQRGNRRQQTFFNQEDYAAYLELMSEWCRDQGVEIWSYCLMPNHAHLIAVPSTEDGLRWAVGEAHRRYTRRINFREKWRGYLWQARFASFVMDEPYLLAAARYIELNPVRAGLVAKAEDCSWSGARAHLAGRDDQFGHGRSFAGHDWRLVRVSQQRHARRGTPGHPPAFAHRPPAGGRGVSGPPGRHGRSAAQAAEARPKAKEESELSYVSPEFPSRDERLRRSRHQESWSLTIPTKTYYAIPGADFATGRSRTGSWISILCRSTWT